MTKKRDAQAFEARRYEAIRLFNKKVSQADIARHLGVSRQAVSHWIGTYLAQGSAALRRKPRPGRPPKLTAAQKKQLLDLLVRGPEKAGYATQLWTADRIRRVVLERFGVRYHIHHVPKLLRECGWSYQRPTGRAKERDEVAVRTWLEKDWPRIKKKRSAAGPP